MRTITPGEVISREVPAVAGPCTRSKPQCLQCFKLISPDTRLDCSGCGFPVCDEECMRGSFHREECLIFRNCGFKADVQDLGVFDRQYSAIIVDFIQKASRERKAYIQFKPTLSIRKVASKLNTLKKKSEKQPVF
jgi:hypothetical protein